MSRDLLPTLLQGLERVSIFGASACGRYALPWLARAGVEVVACSDNDAAKHGSTFEGVPVVAPGELAKDTPVLITSMYARDISVQLADLGVERVYDFSFCTDFERWRGHFDPEGLEAATARQQEAAATFADPASRAGFEALLAFRRTLDPRGVPVSEHPEYFHPLVQPEPDDVIVDGGAWTGRSAVAFARAVDGRCRIHSFEPDPENLRALEATIASEGLSGVVHAEPAGLWEESGRIGFRSSDCNDMQHRVDPNAEERIDVVSLDAFASERDLRVSLIKMDVEGAELSALRGARRIIAEQAPKLQICSYHQPADLWEVPLLIRALNPAYRLYLEHHSQNLWETTVYARAE